MKKILSILILAITFIATSCNVVGTLYPISQNVNDFIFKKEMIGKWGDIRSSSDYYSVDTAIGKNGKLYKIELVFRNKEKNITDITGLSAILVNINGMYFLDCWLDTEKAFSLIDKGYDEWLVARHFIFKVSFPKNDIIEITAPDSEELIKLIDQKKIIAKYASLKKDDFLILDEPAVLQKGFSESNKYPLLYKEKYVLNRLE